MFAGETILSGGAIPEGFTGFMVLKSGAGYYVGYADDEGPYSRETVYTQDYEEASGWRDQLNAVVVDDQIDEDELEKVAFLPFVRM